MFGSKRSQSRQQRGRNQSKVRVYHFINLKVAPHHLNIKFRYIRRADVLSKEIHAKHGLTQEVLQAATMRYQQEPLFLSTMVNLQAQQSDRFVKAAAIFNGEVIMGAPP